jgi:ketosteroid isomerase-like protein
MMKVRRDKMSNTDIIRRFFDAWEAKSLDGILKLMTPDARWLNVGLPESVGQDAIRKAIPPSWPPPAPSKSRSATSPRPVTAPC